MKQKDTGREEQEEPETPESLVTKFCSYSVDTSRLENRIATSRMTRKGWIGV